MALLDETRSVRPSTPDRPPVNALGVRLWLTARASVIMVTSLLGAALFSLWVTLVAVSPLTIVAVLVVPATLLVRAYANVHRRAAGRLLGTPVDEPYRPAPAGVISRVLGIVRDPASWRDALWLLVHAIVGCVTATISVATFLSGLFYLIYPFLYAVTPDPVFRKPFGDWFTLHSVAQSFVVMPAALVMFALWFGVVVPLARTEARLNRALLSPR